MCDVKRSCDRHEETAPYILIQDTYCNNAVLNCAASG